GGPYSHLFYFYYITDCISLSSIYLTSLLLLLYHRLYIFVKYLFDISSTFIITQATYLCQVFVCCCKQYNRWQEWIFSCHLPVRFHILLPWTASSFIPSMMWLTTSVLVFRAAYTFSSTVSLAIRW